MYECGKLKKVIGNKFLFPVILEQCALLLAHPVLGSHLCPCYSIKIHSSGNRTIGDRTSGGPPAQCTYSDSNLKVIQ
jgi:hypothetical protein